MATMEYPAALKELAPPMDFTHFYSRVTKQRNASKMKAFYKYFLIPGIGNLAGGLPNAGYFPYDTLEASVAVPNRFKPTPNDPVDPPSEDIRRLALSSDPKAARVIVPHDSSEKNALRKIDLATALQYGTAQGYPPLYSFIRQLTLEALHPNIPYKDGAEVILTCGSTDGFAKSIEAFSNIWDAERDWIREREGIVCEEFAYMNAIQAVRPRGLNITPIVIDDEGMCAAGKGGLADVLENWDFNKGKRPHLMYTVTMGQNPTSGLLSLTRRKEIYSLCHKYDILIIEDDPYWYLQYPSANGLSIRSRGKPVSENFPVEGETYNYNTASGGKSSGFPFLDSLVPSYLAVDTDGRVVRLDTFSKTVAPGCRLGWITAQPAMVERILRITETSTQQPSGFVQSLIAELIMGPQSPGDGGKGGREDGAGWQVGGWIRWLEGLRGNYERRMQIMATVLDKGKYLVEDSKRQDAQTADALIEHREEDEYQLISKTQMYDFAYPMAGMFLWLHARFESHPLFENKDVPHPRLARALWVFLTTAPYLCLLAPGSTFAPNEEILQEKAWQYFRLCFAAVNDDVVEMHTKHVVDAFRDFWAITSVEKINEILKEDDEENGSQELSMEQGGFAINPAIC